MGTGHVMRMIALGQAWRALGGDVRLVGRTAPLTGRLESEGFEVVPVEAVHPAPEDARGLLDTTGPGDWIAIDGYHFNGAYQRAVRDAGRRTLVVDDFFDRDAYAADILLNQNPDGPDYPYDLPGAVLLLGTRYVLLREEFQRAEPAAPTPDRAADILVTLGGADPDNATGRVLDAIRATSRTDLSITVVAGAANPHLDDLRERIAALDCACALRTNVADMPGLMARCDLAVSAGGTTSWELCYFGVPFIAIEIADNQQGVIRELARHKAARCLDSAASVGDIATELERLIDDAPARRAMREAGMRLVDGKGALRVARTMYNADIRLRPVQTGDCDLLLAWRNHPTTRANSFSTEEIEPDTHRAWFQKKLEDENCLFLMAEDQGEPVGQIRFDLDGLNAVISVAVDPARVNRGIGTVLTRLGCRAMIEKWPGAKAVALVKPDNPASAAMFAKAGFTPDGETGRDLRFIWTGQ